jgi:hypothetical protein
MACISRSAPKKNPPTRSHSHPHSLALSRRPGPTRSHSRPPTHSLTQTNSLTHSLTHSLIHSRSPALPPTPTHSLTYPLTYSLTHSLPHSLTHSLCFCFVFLSPVVLIAFLGFSQRKCGLFPLPPSPCFFCSICFVVFLGVSKQWGTRITIQIFAGNFPSLQRRRSLTDVAPPPPPFHGAPCWNLSLSVSIRRARGRDHSAGHMH